MHTDPSQTFGALVRRYRLAAGLTQEELAERAGLSTRAISNLERGVSQIPHQATLDLLAQALELNAGERAELEAAMRLYRRGLRSISSLLMFPSPPAGAPLAPPVTPLPLPSHPSDPPTPVKLPSSPPKGGRKWVIGLVSVPVVAALFVGILLGTSTLAGQPPSAHGRTLCLATDFPMTGKHAWVGNALEDAVKLAVQQNQNLGNGYALRVINYNDVPPQADFFDTSIGAQNVQQMVQNPCIMGMVGPYNSLVAIAEIPIAANAGLVMISPTNTQPGLTLRQYAELEGVDFDKLHPPKKPLNYFRLAPTDVAQIKVAADFTFDDLGARRVYVINDSYANGEELASFFTVRFQVRGGRIVGSYSFPPANHSGIIQPANLSLITQVAARIVATNPDAVFYGGGTMPGGGLLKAQLVKLGYTRPFVGGDGIANDPNFIAQAGTKAASGTFASVAASDPTIFTSDAAARFVHDYHAIYPNQKLDGYIANAYDAAMVLITAIKQLIQARQKVTRDSMIGQVQRIQYTGVTGPISFDTNGDSAHRVFTIYQVQDGRWVYAQQLSA